MIRLQILTPDEVKFEGEVKSLTAPGFEGEFQVLPHHAPYLALLKAGRFTYRDASNASHTIEIHGGVFEFFQNKATVLLQNLH
ncbi:MAG: F0F1 ATP synthase subunit epsilon [Parachlamydiaceae bacterium]